MKKISKQIISFTTALSVTMAMALSSGGAMAETVAGKEDSGSFAVCLIWR